MLQSSELLEEQRRSGGNIPAAVADIPRTYRFCCPPTTHFGNARQEYEAVLQDTVVFDLSDRTQIELLGEDRQHFLHNFCTNDIKRLEPGNGCEAIVADVKGRILAHVFVFVEACSIWIETVPRAAEQLASHFDHYRIHEDVRWYDRSDQVGQLFVTGPRAADRLTSLDIPPKRLHLYGHCKTDCGSIDLTVRRIDLLGEIGFLLSVNRTNLVELWNSLRATGIRPAGAQAFHTRRIESRFPLYGLDLNKENLAQESGRTAQTISFNKGCYLGQEPIARIDAHGHVNRVLRGLLLESDPVPESGAPIRAGGGQELGIVTSAALHPALNRPVALGLVRCSLSEPGTKLEVRTQVGKVSAIVFDATRQTAEPGS